jgi:hypothetical protein
MSDQRITERLESSAKTIAALQAEVAMLRSAGCALQEAVCALENDATPETWLALDVAEKAWDAALRPSAARKP